jgi:RNA polymerase sigma-70 factor, ECF subfamily
VAGAARAPQMSMCQARDRILTEHLPRLAGSGLHKRHEARHGVNLLVSHLDAAYNLARWLMRDKAEAEDVVQDSYLRAIKGYAGFRGMDGRAWLLAIVRNRCYDRLRQKGASDQTTDFDEAVHSARRPVPDSETALLLLERTELLRKSLAELPAEYREVLVLRELEQLSYHEIAELTGIPLGTVMSRLNRARQRLQQILSPYLERVPLTSQSLPGSPRIVKNIETR